MTEVTVGIDIGTTSVKAIAADGDGVVVARARIPHRLIIPTPDRMEHDADEAWRRGPCDALRALQGSAALDVKGVSVAAMVPSLTAVDAAGVPILPGLLYGDARGRTGREPGASGMPVESGELVAFLRWLRDERPDAAGYWPAQAVANHALSGEVALDTTSATTAVPLFDWTAWDPSVADELGIRTEQLPRVVPTAWAAGRIGGDGPPLASGCIDALAEQLVAGADADGDVLVILGTTLIVWVVSPREVKVPGYYSIPHTTPGKYLIGGPSNAGGLFLNWVLQLVGEGPARPVDPGAVPVWAPYPRGERTPFQDPDRRASLTHLDLTHDAVAVRRAAYEASGFVTRRAIDAVRAHGDVHPRRLVLTGGGVVVEPWVRAVADATRMPCDCVAVPEGGALGSAWLARLAAGLEEPTAMADGRRWARIGRRVEPDPAWANAMGERFERFLAVS